MAKKRTLLFIDHERNCVEVDFDNEYIKNFVNNSLDQNAVQTSKTDKELFAKVKAFIDGEDDERG